MIPAGLPAALRACAHGIYTLEAAAALIIEHATWLARDDFTRLIHVGPGSAFKMAAIDWPAAVATLGADGLPCSDLLTELRRASGHADRSWWAGYVHDS